LTGSRLSGHIRGMEKLSLDALAREQMKLATAAPAGRSARTVYGGHEHVLRQTLMALTAGSSMSEHENPGEATVQVLHGGVRLVADGVEWEGRDGDLLIVPQARHTLHAWRKQPCSSPSPNCHRRPEYPVDRCRLSCKTDSGFKSTRQL
jgi:quercetin dioxygenase-like cupin family protein